MEFPSSAYAYCAHNSLEALKEPPREYWPVYSWTWKHKADREGIAKRLDRMRRQGIRGVYVIPVPKSFTSEAKATKFDEPTLEYLSEEYLENIRIFFEEAERRDMTVWMYDEAGYPSGCANGEIVAEDPSLQAQGIDINGNRTWIPPVAQPYPDLLNPAVTRRFLEITHEAYKSVTEDFGKTFPLVFTDEPHVRTFDGASVPWTDGFAEKFRELFGYDILQYLPALMDDDMPGEENRKARADYHDLVSRLFAENYFRAIRDWCRENGSLSAGHVAGDDVAFGNAKWGFHHILRCLRQMDVPGVDCIWRQAFPGPEMPGIEPYAPLCANSFFPRYASSAAHHTGARLSLTELFAIYGAGISYDQMRWLSNFHIARGINVLNPMNTKYDYTAVTLARGGLPTFSPSLPGAEDLACFNEWGARACYVMSAGKPVSDSALYMPMRDIWPGDALAREIAEAFEALGAELEKRGCDFDLADDDAILAAEIREGALCVGDGTYRVLYVQEGAAFPAETAEKLALWEKQGGKIIRCAGEYAACPAIETDSRDIRVCRRALPEGRVYYLANEGWTGTTAEIRFPSETAERAWRLDLATGEKTPVSASPFRWQAAFGEEAVLLFGGDVPEVQPAPETPVHALELTAFTFRKLRASEITAEGLIRRDVEEEAVFVSSGDWRSFAGESFSGDGEYRTVFSAPEGVSEMLLDLGAVKYSCEVFLNGKSMGTQIFSPFLFRLTELKAENELTIRVSNTLANAYTAAKFDQWFPGMDLGIFYDMHRRYEKESLESGLCGPVTLRW